MTPRRSPASTGRRSSSTTGPGSPRTPARFQAALARTGLPFASGSRSRPTRGPRCCEVLRALGAPGTPGERRHRRLLAGRGRARARVRLAARRDQLHRHQRVRARPRRAARPRRPPEPRRDQPDRALRTARAGRHDRDPDRPGCRRRLQRRTSSTAGDRPTKFGIGLERLDEALAAAARHDLAVDTVHFHAGSGWLADGLAGFERALAAGRRGGRAACAPRATAIVEVNVGGGLGRAGPRGRARRRSRCLRRRPRSASRAARRDDRVRAGRPPLEGRRDPPRRGRDGRDAARRHVRRARHRLERQLLVLHLPLRPGDRRLPGRRRARGPTSSPSPATSTRRATCSPRTTRCRRSRRATWSRCSTPAATSRR